MSEQTVDLILRNPSGLHIRPAALISMALVSLDAVVTITNLRTGSDALLANSATALLTLAARQGDVVRVVAFGAEATQAIAAVSALFDDGFGELNSVPDQQFGAPQGAESLGVSPGQGVGPVVRMPEPPVALAAGVRIPKRARAAAAARIDVAARAVAVTLRARADQVAGEARDILNAEAQLALEVPRMSDAQSAVIANGDSPEIAIWAAIGALADDFAEQGGRMAERVVDLHDLRARLVAELMGAPEPGVPVREDPYVLVAHDLAPADAALLDPDLCHGVVTVEGGPTSHTAILLRSLGIPAVVTPAGALEIPEGTMVLVDGTAGTLTIKPSTQEIASTMVLTHSGERFSGTGSTADGHRVPLFANIGSPGSLAAARADNAEGVGLLRTEFLYLDRAEAPTIDEQVVAYRSVFATFAGKPVIVRTLDAGGDKPLAFVTAARQPNPALGIRGYRTAWRTPELIADQLRAIALAASAESAEVRVMAPMIDTPDDAAAFAHRCADHGLRSVGIMIETPASAITAPELLSLVDFASIGTNDLAQYTMAADRQVGELARLNDPWQPAVLRMMRLALDAGKLAGKQIGVCGEAAADPLMAAVLVGLGASSLSMTSRALARVSDLLGSVTLEKCEEAAARASATRSARSARAAAARALGIGR